MPTNLQQIDRCENSHEASFIEDLVWIDEAHSRERFQQTTCFQLLAQSIFADPGKALFANIWPKKTWTCGLLEMEELRSKIEVSSYLFQTVPLNEVIISYSCTCFVFVTTCTTFGLLSSTFRFGLPGYGHVFRCGQSTCTQLDIE
jgi:hypothetical protein